MKCSWINTFYTRLRAIPYQKNQEGHHDDALQNISSEVSCQASSAKIQT